MNVEEVIIEVKMRKGVKITFCRSRSGWYE